MLKLVIYFLFFSSDAIALIVMETNRYADQCRAQCTSTPRAWHDNTENKLKAFIGSA